LSADFIARMKSGIDKSRMQTPISGGKPLLRLLKAGVWVFGQADDPVQIGSEWAVNPMSMRHGWVCWSNYPGNTKNELLGESMSPVYDDMPICPAPIGDSEFKGQRVFEAKCILGEDTGVEVLYKVNSIGGLRAFDSLIAAVRQQLDDNPDYPVPVLQLDSSPYDHQKYGQIFNPILELVAWLDMDNTRRVGKDNSGGKPALTQASEPAPQKAPQPAKKPALKAVDLGEQPDIAAAAQQRPGAAPRRQRPAARA
jgi:hypothetical protein